MAMLFSVRFSQVNARDLQLHAKRILCNTVLGVLASDRRQVMYMREIAYCFQTTLFVRRGHALTGREPNGTARLR